MERLSDSCILQLIRTSFTTFLVDNIRLLQLKAISLISGVTNLNYSILSCLSMKYAVFILVCCISVGIQIYYTYTQHRAYVMDEALQVLLKLPFSKRVPRTYHLPDEEQKQIQIITALLIQIVHCSANLPEVLRQTSGVPSLDVSVDGSYPTKCHEAITESCVLFWSRVLQRLTGSKTQDSAELKIMIENLVVDLLVTLNLPEYPAAAPILEVDLLLSNIFNWVNTISMLRACYVQVLCVLLLQNAGLKSKDIAARSMAIDLLGTVAARLKHDAVVCQKENFWIVHEFINGNHISAREACSVCLDLRNDKPVFVCEGCHRIFHLDCAGNGGNTISTQNLYCPICLYKKQLIALYSHCEAQGMECSKKNSRKSLQSSDIVTSSEIVQQMLLNFLEPAGDADVHLHTRWSVATSIC